MVEFPSLETFHRPGIQCGVRSCRAVFDLPLQSVLLVMTCQTFWTKPIWMVSWRAMLRGMLALIGILPVSSVPKFEPSGVLAQLREVAVNMKERE
jgi:hypothetical protein